MSKNYQKQIGRAIARFRQEKDWTQSELARRVKTSQSAIHRIEAGEQNISLDQIEKISKVLRREIISVNSSVVKNYRITGGRTLSGDITINTSKNAAVGLLCAALLNHGRTVLRNLAQIEEVYRIIEVLESIGVKCRWLKDENENDNQQDLEIISPDELDLANMDIGAARKTRSILMFMGPFLHRFTHFRLPFAGGCTLGKRTVDPHLRALSAFGLHVEAKQSGFYEARVDKRMRSNGRPLRVVLIERGDTVTENALMAAALYPGETTIVGASPNYMVQDICFFLEKLGVAIEGIGTTTLVVHGVGRIEEEVEFFPSEDPIEAMSFIATGIVTKSEITVKRAPIEFLEIELEVLRSMGAKIVRSPEYLSYNRRTRLVDLTVKKAKLYAPNDKIHPMPFPGLNIDNLPFFSVIACQAKGRTLIHDWVFENRAIYTTDLANLNAKVELLDAHRVYIEGPTNWRPAEMVAPQALRPAVVVLLAMLAAPGTSILRNIYPIKRGYQDFAARLRHLGADITPLTGI